MDERRCRCDGVGVFRGLVDGSKGVDSEIVSIRVAVVEVGVASDNVADVGARLLLVLVLLLFLMEVSIVDSVNKGEDAEGTPDEGVRRGSGPDNVGDFEGTQNQTLKRAENNSR